MGDSSVGIVTDYGLDGPDSIPGSGRFFYLQRPDQLWGLPSLLSKGYRRGALSPMVKRQGSETDHPPPSMPRSRRVELYLYSPHISSWRND
jgi:hypothetical protein